MLGKIVDALTQSVPAITDVFSPAIPVKSVTLNADVVTVIFDKPHGLSTGDTILVKGVGLVNPIDKITPLTSDEAAFETKIDHDLTQNYQNVVKIEDSSGVATGTPTLISVPNRRNFSADYDKTIDWPKVGNATLIEFREIDAVNKKQTVNVISNVEITFKLDPEFAFSDLFFDPKKTKISIAVRIAGVSDQSRASTAFERTDCAGIWLYAALDDITIGKNREAPNDSISDQGRNSDWNVEMLRQFSTYVYIPLDNDTIGFKAANLADSMRWVLYKAIAGVFMPETPEGVYQYSGVMPIGDGPLAITNSYYVHVFQWQIASQIEAKAVNEGAPTVAFRDIWLSTSNNFDTIITEDKIDLDDKPLRGAP